MEDVFNFLTELALDPFAAPSPEQTRRAEDSLRSADRSNDERIAGGSFDACRTCSDPGPDEPFPDFEDQFSSW